jgi:hypothetical protein
LEGVINASARLKSAEGVFQLKQTAYYQAANATDTAQASYDAASGYFNQSKQALSDSTSQFITAQT